MPLRTTDTSRLKARLIGRLPPRTLVVVPVVGDATTIRAYLARSGDDIAVDQFGVPEYTAVLHVTSGSVAQGDEIEATHVVWNELPESTFERYGLRDIPPFETWTRIRRNVATTDADTEITTYSDVSSDIQAYLEKRSSRVVEGEGQDLRVDKAVLIAKPNVLQVNDELLRSGERYEVYAVDSYGPYERVYAEAS